MTFDTRSLAIATAGFCAFVNLYSVQALLPDLAAEFHVSASDISWLMTAGTGAIALTAPFTGALADVLGRKRLITAAMFAIVVPPRQWGHGPPLRRVPCAPPSLWRGSPLESSERTAVPQARRGPRCGELH